MKKYIRAKNIQGRWVGQIIHYEGDRIVVEWTSLECDSKENAIDSAVEHSEDMDIDIESIEF